MYDESITCSNHEATDCNYKKNDLFFPNKKYKNDLEKFFLIKPNS